MAKPTATAPPARGPAAFPARTKWLVDRTAVGLFAAIWLGATLRTAPRAWQPDLVLALPLGVLAAYLLADFLAGAVHWLADRCFEPDTPVLGPMLIAPFRAHHDDPASIGRHDFFEVAGNNALVSVPLAAALVALPVPRDLPTTLLFVFSTSLALFLVATNVFHGWAHAARPPRLARALQRRGLILTPARHALHHRGAHDRAYCVTSGWLNPLLDRSGFFAAIERHLGRRAREVDGHEASDLPRESASTR